MANVLLLEPVYKNKYPPLGLMKIAAYHRTKNDRIRFAKGIRPDLLKQRWDRVYVTTLFSFEFARTAKQIDFAIECANGQHRRVFVGGIAASLMTEEFINDPRWFGVRFISGLLDRAPAESLLLDADMGDFYADDIDGLPIEDYIPDYSILADIEDQYVYPVNDAYFGYASRGCIRKCHFCGVPKLEGAQRDAMPITSLVEGIAGIHGEKRDLILMDNNITASPRYKEVMEEIRSLGFERDAVLVRDGRKLKRRVDFNQGVDARILCKDPMYLREMSKICISPLRIAFDHLGLRKPYVQAVRYANEFGINQLSNYMLFNFHDSPADLYERLRINIDLNEELGVRIWSFPMRYQPVTLKDRSHVGPKWIWYWLRSFQIILQATHGVVSGNPEYFCRAFGETRQDFETILSMPHHMIFHRDYFDHYEGRAEREAFQLLVNRLSEGQRNDWINGLAAFFSSGLANIDDVISSNPDGLVRELLGFYRPVGKEGEENIKRLLAGRKLVTFASLVDPALSDEQRVEDAGLNEDEPARVDQPAVAPNRRRCAASR